MSDRHHWTAGLIGILSTLLLSGCYIAGGHGGQTHHPREPEVEHRSAAGVCGPGGPPPWAPAHGYRRKCRYRYYPHHEVYFSISAETYFWRVEGSWRHGDHLPDHFSIEGHDYVTLSLKTDKPYEHHEEIREKHGPHGKGNRGRGKGPPDEGWVPPGQR